MRFLLIVVLIMVSGVTLAQAQPPQPLIVCDQSYCGGHDWRVGVLDGQGCYPDPDTSCWVFNRTECVWNDQDDRLLSGHGYIEGTFTAQQCLVADYTCCGSSAYPHGIYVNVSAPGDTLEVALDNDVGNHWEAGPSVRDKNRRLWRICVTDPVALAGGITHRSGLEYWPEIPDSNGGRGQIVEYALTVTSRTKTRDANVGFEIATRYHNPPVAGEHHTITNCP